MADELWKELSPEELAASKEFKKNPFKTEPMKVLEKRLTKGVPSTFVKRLLGKPHETHEAGKLKKGSGAVWIYILGYSSFARIEFDHSIRVRNVEVH